MLLWAQAASGAGFGIVPPPEGGSITSLYASRTRQFAATPYGVFWRKAGEARWVLAADSSLHGEIEEVLGSGDTVAVNTPRGGRISLDNGETWRPVEFPGRTDPDQGDLSILLVTPGGIFAEGRPSHSDLRHSPDFGKSWRPSLLPGKEVRSLAAWNGALVADISGDGMVSLDPLSGAMAPLQSGLPPEARFQVAASGPNLFAGSSEAKVYRYDAAAKAWSQVWQLPESTGEAVVRVRGDSLWAYGHSPGSLVLHRSADRGDHWTSAGPFPLPGVTGLLPMGKEVLLAFGSLAGMVRLDPLDSTWSDDHAGLRNTRIENMTLAGGRIFAHAAGHPDVFMTVNRGNAWSRLEFRGVGGLSSLHTVGTEVFVNTGEKFGRYDPSGGKFDSVATLQPMRVVKKWMDAGSRYVILGMEFRFPGGPTNVLYAAPKQTLHWTFLPTPSTKDTVLDMAAAGDQVLSLTTSGLFLLRHENTGWEPVPFPAGKPNALHRLGDRWLASSGTGLFAADSLFKGWNPVAFASLPVTLMAVRGDRILLRQDSTSLHFSADRGLSWREAVLPFPVSEAHAVALSDSLVCVNRAGRGYLPDFKGLYCSDLPGPPVPAAEPVRRSGRWVDMAGRAGRAGRRESGRLLFRRVDLPEGRNGFDAAGRRSRAEVMRR